MRRFATGAVSNIAPFHGHHAPPLADIAAFGDDQRELR